MILYVKVWIRINFIFIELLIIFKIDILCVFIWIITLTSGIEKQNIKSQYLSDYKNFQKYTDWPEKSTQNKIWREDVHLKWL
jgi:hypothetical protein